MDRILVNTAALVTGTFYQDGAPTAADGAVTVTVASDDGTTIATDAATTTTTTGVYRYGLEALQSVDRLTLTWSGIFSGAPTSITTRVEIVGGYYASMADIRASDPSLDDLARYPWDAIDAARTEAEDEAERIMGRAFVRRYRRDERLRPNSQGIVTTTMAHVQKLRRVAVTTPGVGTVTIDPASCWITGECHVAVPYAARDALVTLDYEHGLDEAPYEVAAKGVVVRARQIAQRAYSGVPESSESSTLTEFGVIRHVRPTAASTGQAIVDAVYDSYSLRRGVG